MPKLDLMSRVREARASGLSNPAWLTAHPDEVNQVPSREHDRTIRVHVYNTRKEVQGPVPVLINFHGSGFIMPLHGRDDEFALSVVRNTGYMVLDCSYRLAPEHPWPAALQDAEDVVRWVLAQPARFDLYSLTLSGFSAGANLALVLSTEVLRAHTVSQVVAIYPVTNLACNFRLELAPDTTGPDAVPVEMMELFVEAYLPANCDPGNVFVSPAFSPVEKFPNRLFIATAARDRLCPAAEELAERIGKTNKYVETVRFSGCEHGFDREYMRGSLEEMAKDHLYDWVAAFLNGC
ncbi:hypothetical protein ABZX51_005920 [Aspergillus tubingensis]